MCQMTLVASMQDVPESGVAGVGGHAAVLPMQGWLQVRGFQLGLCLLLINASIVSSLIFTVPVGLSAALVQPTVLAEASCLP